METPFSKMTSSRARTCFETMPLVICLLAAGGAAARADAETAAQQVVRAPLFLERMIWVGSQPSEAESQALLADIAVFKTGGVEPGFAALEQFVAKYPQSGWTPDLEVHLAEHDRARGRYAEALSYWQAAWDETKDAKDVKAQELAVRGIAGWTYLLASLGHKNQLENLFADLSSRQLPLGPYATRIEETKEGLASMNAEPGKSYRCGSLALEHLALAMHSKQSTIQRLFAIDSPNGGFTMSELLALARTNGLDVEAVRRPSGAPLIVPCVVHWKLNHYAAITEEKSGRYRVIDPTFQHSVWMDAATINAEASGDFILPKNRVPDSWQPLSQVACSRIYGKGNPGKYNDHNDTGCGGPNGSANGSGSAIQPPNMQPPSQNPKNCPCQTQTNGMPQWSVSEPYENVWLRDTPLAYKVSDLDWEGLNVSYKQRGESQISTICGFGNNWSCDWIDMMQQASDSDTLDDYLGSGGVISFPSNGTNEYKTGGTAYMAEFNGSDPPVVAWPDGSTNYYGYAVGVLSGNTNYFLTAQTDRYGRMLRQFNYQTVGGVVQLASVVDLDGKTNTLAYGNSAFPNLITQVTDRYGRTAYFKYDTNGLLTNMVDAQGMSTFFQYDTNSDVTNMITPYGTTSFQIFNSVDSSHTNAPSRAVLITEANGDHQLYEHQDNALDGTVDTDLASYHWNRKQYEAISDAGKANVFAMTAPDYHAASAKTFLFDPDEDGDTIGDTMSLEADPVDPVWGVRTGQLTYQYYGQPNSTLAGPLKRVILITEGSIDCVDMAYNDLGNLTNCVYAGNAAPLASYTNFYDSTGRIIQSETGPQSELTFGCGFNGSVPNLVTSITNAVGDVTRYTYDSGMRLTSITFPGGLVRTNIYYTSGPETGFLAQQIDVGFRTNSFGWLDGNLVTQTNELGLLTDYTYDNLNRLTSTTYSDGTTVSNVYDKLDVVATKDRLNQWTYYGYNQVRQLMAMTNVDGQVTTYDYCGCGAPDVIVNGNGASALTTSIAYNTAGLVTNVLYPDGYTLNYTYDKNDLLQTITDGAGYQETLTLYLHGLEQKLVEADLSGLGMPSQKLLSQTFDQYGRVIQNSDRNGVETTNGFDLVGRLIARQSMGESEYSAQSGLESFDYGPLGPTNYVDQLGHVTAYGRDLEGRIVTETNANNEVQQFAYNPAGEMLALTDGNSHTRFWNYDEFGRVTNKLDASGITNFIFQYDADDRLTNRWTPAKGATVYRYDPLGNVTNVDYSGGTAYTPSVYFGYDFMNRLTNMFDGIGSTAFAWTPGDQLASESGPWPDDTVSYYYNMSRQRSIMSLAQPNANPWNLTYGYDNLMRLATIMSPAGGNFSSPMGTFTYQYNYAMDRPSKVSMPGPGNPTVWPHYDGLARDIDTSLQSAEPQLDVLPSYDEGSEVTQQEFSVSGQYNRYMKYSYDNIGQLKAAQGFESDLTTHRLQEQFGYAYDSAGNLAERTNNALIQSFGVNNVNELSGASESGTLTVGGTAGELNGDLASPGVTSVTVNGQSANLYQDGSFAAPGFTTTPGQKTYTAIAQDNASAQSTNSVTVNVSSGASYAYDSNGNLLSDGTRNFAYDDEDQLVSVWVANTWSNSFAYDGLMRKRIERDFAWSGSQWAETNEVHYIYDGYLVLQERDQNNNPLTTYTRGVDLSGTLQGAGGIGGLLARSDSQKNVPAVLVPANPNPQNVVSSYYFNDDKGNIMALVSPAGMILAQYEYDPFGNLISKSGLMADLNKYRFSSKEWEGNAGLFYYGYRFYDPNLQRWPSRDPIQEFGGINIYRFCQNDPVGWLDPLGLQSTYFDANYGDVGSYQNPANLPIVGGIAAAGLAVGLAATGVGLAVDAYGGSILGLLGLGGAAAETPEGQAELNEAEEALANAASAVKTCPVSRWGRPGLQPGDWVMTGKTSPLNYLMSGKYQPSWFPGNNIPAPYSSGVTFNVPPSSLSFPTGPLGAIKGLVGQRIYNPQ